MLRAVDGSVITATTLFLDEDDNTILPAPGYPKVALLDKDKTVIKSLAKLKPDIFANGGDRHTLNDIPEYPICQKLGIVMVDGLGKKIRASSELIRKAAAAKIISVKK